MTATDRSSTDLAPALCRERLLAGRSGFLSCTRYAMPLVVPVELDCSDGQVLLTVHDRCLCGPLAGHVVALTVAGPGWAVAAIGRLSTADDNALALEVSSLQGWTYPAADSRQLTAAPDRSAGATAQDRADDS